MSTTTTWASLRDGVSTVAKDVADGFVEITHSGVALLGMGVVLAGAVLAVQPDLRHQGETALRNWLQDRQIAASGVTPELNAIERATASNPADLPKEQAQVAFWIAKKYKVAPEPLAALVAEASSRAKEAGAVDLRVTIDREVNEVEIEGRTMFIEARITATASGRPRVAH